MSSLTATVENQAMPGLAAADSPRTIRQALPIFLRHGSPRVLLSLCAASLIWRVKLGAFSMWDLVPILGLLAVWPLQEWLIHVFILHFKPISLGRLTIDFRVPKKHRAHHGDPWNYDILFIPMQSFLYTVPLIVALWYGITPTTELAWTGIATYLALALHYEWIHYMVHTRYTPTTRYYQRLWKNHRLHHFKNEKFWFGVTRLEGDWLLRTQPAAKEVALSPTAKSLLGQAA